MTAVRCGNGYLSFVQIVEERVPDFRVYPFSLPVVATLRERLRLHPRATFFVGESKTAKSKPKSK